MQSGIIQWRAEEFMIAPGSIISCVVSSRRANKRDVCRSTVTSVRKFTPRHLSFPVNRLFLPDARFEPRLLSTWTCVFCQSCSSARSCGTTLIDCGFLFPFFSMPRLHTHVLFSRDNENRARFITRQVGQSFKLVAPCSQ